MLGAKLRMSINTIQKIMERLYQPYIMLNGDWSYDTYSDLCEKHSFTKDALVTTFTDRIGFLVAAMHTFPDLPAVEALVSYSKHTMTIQYQKSIASSGGAGTATGHTPPHANATVTGVTIKPCCGGGKVL